MAAEQTSCGSTQEAEDEEVTDKKHGYPCRPDMLLLERGLESYSPFGLRNKMRNRENALSAVLCEQALQYSENVYDEFSLARVYIASTHHCRVTAYKTAILDQAAAADADEERSTSS